MKRLRSGVFLGAFLLSILPASLGVGSSESELPVHRAEDADAPVVSEGNLLASERFWPYQTELTRSWQPPGRGQPLAAGTLGVLIRVEASGLARIDFGRDGLYAVPIGETDLLDRANRVRRGELHKMAPNLVLAIGPRLLDPAWSPPRPLNLSAVSASAGFLCVFADPGAGSFADLAATLAPLRGSHGVETILFPQGEYSDADLGEQLRLLGWTVPFVSDHLAEAYTRSLLSDGGALPAVLLQSREGRLLFQGRGTADVVAELRAALDEAFGGPPQ